MEATNTSAGHICDFCQEVFPSKTKLFKHLVVHGYESNFLKPTKVVLLVAWLAPPPAHDSEEYISDQAWNCLLGDSTSFAVEQALFRAVYVMENRLQSLADIPADITEMERPRGFSRGASCVQRTSALFGTEPTCHGLCDTYCLLVRPLGSSTMEDFVATVNSMLPDHISVLHGYELSSESASSFQAETECTQRRYEYMAPLSVLMPDGLVQPPAEKIVRKSAYRNQQEDSVILMDHKFPIDTEDGQTRIAHFRKLKEISKDFHGRKRFHNYTTACATPNDTTTMRRVDRIYHKDLVMIDGVPWVILSVTGDGLLRGQVRRLLGMMLAVALDFLPQSYLQATLGDAVLEVPTLPGWGLYLAECRYANWEACYPRRLDPRRDNADCSKIVAWTERLHQHIASQEVFGANWIDGFRNQCQGILSRHMTIRTLQDRSMDALKEKFADVFGIADPQEVASLCNEGWTESKLAEVSSASPAGALSPIDGTPGTTTPTEVKTARMDKDLYRRLQAEMSFVNLLPGFDDCPAVYREVLTLLRAADRSQCWPASSTGRQSVISSPSLLEQGGRGGSFSVGALPKHLIQPKGNDLFPELMRACFRLERALCPDRPPSATIAINRHAQFLPHRDTGAGNGQSTSLIVGLGAYVGGEIVVDQVVHDMRYQPVEFNGWKSIHYTLPFVGERYSLVWFTPLGLSEEDLWWWKDM